jgi:outer membrane murein-binding lipoprotein Lpp
MLRVVLLECQLDVGSNVQVAAVARSFNMRVRVLSGVGSVIATEIFLAGCVHQLVAPGDKVRGGSPTVSELSPAESRLADDV